MIIRCKYLFINNIILKLWSLILAYAIWRSLGSYISTVLTLTVPLCFYNVPMNYSISAPEKITIHLFGKRNNLYLLSLQELAVHYDATLLHEGKNSILIEQDNVCIPKKTKLIRYNPLPLIVYVQKDEHEESKI